MVFLHLPFVLDELSLRADLCLTPTPLACVACACGVCCLWHLPPTFHNAYLNSQLHAYSYRLKCSLSPACCLPIASLLPPCRRYQSPALYHRFNHSVTSIMSSLSLFRAGERVSFVPLKTRSVSALIAVIDRISNAIAVSCG
jgi:hypothetical protein